jgi:hypothetical protein
MEVPTAIRIINDGICFMPGWQITASDFTGRHQGTICLHVEYPGRETARREAPDYKLHNRPRAAFLIQVANIRDDIELHRKVLDKLIEFWTHEARESYRVNPSMWAPFHPHNQDGMERWGDVEKDLHYGFNAMDWSCAEPSLPIYQGA